MADMTVIFVPGNEINSDLGVVNAARVSLAKKSFLERVHKLGCESCYYDEPINTTCMEESHYSFEMQPSDIKLIHYLASHNHWTPFAHSRLYFVIDWEAFGVEEELYLYKNFNSAGFACIDHSGHTYMKGSLYSWLHSLQYMPQAMADYVHFVASNSYPVSTAALVLNRAPEPFHYLSHTMDLTERFISIQSNPQFYKLMTATLLITVPIFVARQIRTSQIAIAYSDLYVEGEAFAYNEVSRRYVNEEPQFYDIKQWRVREGSKVKQGSTGLAVKTVNTKFINYQSHNIEEALSDYYEAEKYTIAPEQARCLLPQSMMTTFYMTATLHRWSQWLSLRLDKHVQQETREVASLIKDSLSCNFPKWSLDKMVAVE